MSTTQLPLALTSIQTDNITITAANSKPIKILNATITALYTQGTLHSMLTADTMQLSPFARGSYTAFDFPDGCQWTINLSSDAQVTIDYNDGAAHTVSTKGGIITLYSPSTTLLTTMPDLTNQGQTVFSKGYIGWIGSSDKVTSEGNQFSINGNVLTIDCVDGTTALLSNLTYSGSATTPAASTATRR